MTGNIIDTVLTGVQGAAGGINFTINGSSLLYTRDISEYESSNYRLLNSHIFLYEFATAEVTDLSEGKADGTNDLDPRLSPNEAEIIFVNTSNDGISTKTIYKIPFSEGSTTRTALFENATMPDWE